jgi:hypothetical protein
MRRRFFACFLAAPALCHADPTEVERQVQRALIERDRQAAEFSRPELRDLPQPSPAAPLRPDERTMRAREREAYQLNPPPKAPAPAAPSAKPLPLPGGPGHAVDPVPVQGPRSEAGVQRDESGMRDVPRVDLEKRP